MRISNASSYPMKFQRAPQIRFGTQRPQPLEQAEARSSEQDEQKSKYIFAALIGVTELFITGFMASIALQEKAYGAVAGIGLGGLSAGIMSIGCLLATPPLGANRVVPSESAEVEMQPVRQNTNTLAIV